MVYSQFVYDATYVYIRTENSSTGCVGFVKCFDIEVFCSFWIIPVSCESKKKKQTPILFTVLNVFIKALNFHFWQVSQSFECKSYK